LENEEAIKASTEKLRREIEKVNQRLSQDDKDTILQEADSDNPEGYECSNTVLEVKEVQFVDQVRCYNTSEEICSMVKKNPCFF